MHCKKYCVSGDNDKIKVNLMKSQDMLDNNSMTWKTIKDKHCFKFVSTLSGVKRGASVKFYNNNNNSVTVNVGVKDDNVMTFQKLVNSNVQQGFKNGRLPVGVSLGGKNIYIAKQKGGFAITKYKQLRREFIDIMNLQNINK